MIVKVQVNVSHVQWETVKPNLAQSSYFFCFNKGNVDVSWLLLTIKDASTTRISPNTQCDRNLNECPKAIKVLTKNISLKLTITLWNKCISLGQWHICKIYSLFDDTVAHMTPEKTWSRSYYSSKIYSLAAPSRYHSFTVCCLKMTTILFNVYTASHKKKPGTFFKL